MGKRIVAALALAMLWGGAPTALSAQNADPVGYVDRKRGAAGTEVWIERDDARVRAVPGAPLQAGDTVRVRGDGNFVKVRIAGVKGARTVTSGQSFTIEQPEEPGWADRFSALVANVGNALGITDRMTTGNTYSRGTTTEDPQTGDAPSAELLSRVPALDTDTLYAADGLDLLALRWCGDALDVRAFAEGLQIEGEKPRDIGFGAADIISFVDVEGDTEYPADTLEVVPATGPELTYGIKWIALEDIPRPAGLPDVSHMSVSDKVEWANWLIEDSQGVLGNQYNLIAFSLLAEARDDVWVAGYALERASYCPSSN